MAQEGIGSINDQLSMPIDLWLEVRGVIAKQQEKRKNVHH